MKPARLEAARQPDDERLAARGRGAGRARAEFRGTGGSSTSSRPAELAARSAEYPLVGTIALAWESFLRRAILASGSSSSTPSRAAPPSGRAALPRRARSAAERRAARGSPAVDGAAARLRRAGGGERARAISARVSAGSITSSSSNSVGGVERLRVLVGCGGQRAHARSRSVGVGDRLQLASAARAARRLRGPSRRGRRVGQATVSSGSWKLPPAIAWAPRP